MRTIIAGSRTISQDAVLEALRLCSWAKEITIVISGCARGADTYGEIWAQQRGIEVERYPAKWDLYGNKAGAIRNTEMAKVADALVAVWDGSSRGTKHMIDTALFKGLKVFVHVPNKK